MVGNTKEANSGKGEEQPTQENSGAKNFFSQEWRQQVKKSPEGKFGLQPRAKKPLLPSEQQKLMIL